MAKKMTDAELVALVDNEFESSMGREGHDISQERAKAMDFYMSRPLGNEIEGQSSVRTSDVADVVDAIMPSLLRIFTISDNLVNFDPVGFEDIEASAQESDAVNYVFFKQNPAFMNLYSWFWDALVQKNGIVKAWWDETVEVTTETYEGLSEQELTLLMSDDELEPVEQEERTETITVPMVTPMGVLPRDVEQVVYDVKFKRTTKKGRARIEPVPPEEYRISSDATSVDPASARMTGHEREVTRSMAIQMGFDKDTVMSLPMSNMAARTGEERSARNENAEELTVVNPTVDPAEEMILLREAYIRCDYDGDGVSELRQVFTSGGELLSNEEADRTIFHVLCPKPIPHKHFGRSIADMIMDIQEVMTTLLRQTLDNLYLSDNPRHGVWEMGMSDNTLEDLLSSQAGSIVRFDRPPSEAYSQMATPFVAQHSFPAMEYFDKLARKRTGVHEDAEGLSPEALKNIQRGVMSSAMDMSRGKIEAIARIFAETGTKSVMLHIHELLRKHQDREMVVKLRNTWVEVDPSEWRERNDMTVAVGLGMGSRDTKLMHLQSIIELQQVYQQAGATGVLITPQNLWNTADELVKAADLKLTEKFFSKPQPDAEIGDKNAEQQSQFQQALLQVEQQKNELKAQKQEFDAQKDIAQLQQKLQDQQADNSLKAEQMQQTFMIEMEKLRNQLTEMELKYNTNVPGSKV